MTLPEIDHVSFLVEHAQTFFAGENEQGGIWLAHAMAGNQKLARKVTVLLEAVSLVL